MNNALADKLAEQWRDALSAYVIHHVLPDKLQASSLNMITADHLDRYFMMDTQATSAVTTSYLAEALACTQSYINSIFNNIEPGYDQDFDPALVRFWQQAMSNYSLWAGYQMLEDYPENYIRADMRLDKTQLFKSLENDLGQGKISDATVQSALLTYLKNYEYQNSIRVRSGYIDYQGHHHDGDRFDGYTFANSDYYLLGRDTATPAHYYWRKVQVRLDAASTLIQPDAWSEWQPIAMPTGNTVIQARLVQFCGRLHLVWLHHGAPVEEQGSDRQRYALRLDMIHLGLDNQWSTPETLWSETLLLEKSSAQEAELASYQLLALAVARARGSDDQLCIALRQGSEETFSIQRDVLKRETPGDQAFDKEARTRLFKYFTDDGTKVKFQRRLASSQWELTCVKPSDGNDPFLELDVLFEECTNGTHRLHVRGRSSEVRTRVAPMDVYLSCVLALPADGWMRVDVRSTHRGTLEFRCTTNGKPTFERATLAHPAMPAPLSLYATAFDRTDYGWYEATAELDRTALDSSLAGYSAQQVREGAEFSVQVGSAGQQRLASTNNFVTVHAESVVLESMTLTVGAKDLWRDAFTLNGGAATAWCTHDWKAPASRSSAATLDVSFGPTGGEPATFTLTLAKAVDPSGASLPFVERQGSGTDFLVLDLGGTPLVARLNSQHVPDLINRAQASPQAVFAWDAQHLQEPAYDETPDAKAHGDWLRTKDDPLLNMYDASGLYLRELFFHVPHLIASRLQEEERFEEARRWLALIFNPQRRQASTEHPGPEYWSCAWVLRDDTPGAGLEHQLLDPHSIALHAPSHYRKAVFVQYVQLLMGEADLLYRRQTRDSLAAAWLLYRMAADLMGDVPDARAINTWQPKTVKQLLAQASDDLLLECQGQVCAPADLPKHVSTLVRVGVAAHPAFRLPVNQQLMDTWHLLEQRFHNLRHFLTLDGQPMMLPLYAPAANPFDLLMARMGGGANLSHLMGYRTVVPPYRFRTIIGKAHEVVATLIQFGEQLRSLMELENRTELEALQYQQAAEIASYTIGIQEQLHQQQQKNQEVLRAQRDATELRQAHYTRLYADNISAGENAAMSLHGIGQSLTHLGTGAIGLSYLAELAPNIFGLANGGSKYKGAMMAVGHGLQVQGGNMRTAAELLRETEGYRRRREEWQLQAKLAGKELQVLDKQLQVQQHATLASQRALEHSRKALEHTHQLYAFYQNKSTSVSLYRWLRSQTATLHATLFDVAVSLCNSAEACWQYETGNFDKRIIRTPVWQADRHGLNAGNELRLDLLRLEAEALLRNERHLEVRKTVSLKALVEHRLVFDKSGKAVEKWETLLQHMPTDGELSFSLSEALFNSDYPGHYMRRLHSVALSLPALLGPYQNIRATLTQKQSRLLIKPDIEGVKFLSPGATDDDEKGDGRNVMMSLRARQQVCLSSANQDIGLVTAPEMDDRYLPFEGTGAVSDWHLRFPRSAQQADLLESLSDIILEVRYFALHGGPQFESAVEALSASPSRV